MDSFSECVNQQDKKFLQNPKRPKVSAVRSFPGGCGVYASKVNSNESEDHLTHLHSLENKTQSNFTPRKYPPRGILNGVSVRRDFPVGCGSQNFNHSFHLNNQNRSMVVAKPSEEFSSIIEPLQAKPLEEVSSRIEPLQAYHRVGSLHVCSGVDPDGEKVKETSNLAKPLGEVFSTIEHLQAKPLEEVSSRIEPCQVYRGVGSLHVCNGIDHDREKVKETLNLFHELFIRGHAANSGINKNTTLKVLRKVLKFLRMNLKCINTGKRLGSILGVEVGDKFQWMAELYVIGLHLQFINGIDFTEMGGKVLATSVVDSGRYAYDDVEFCDVLIYSGQGGNPTTGRNKEPEDQKLERGNLALKNSMEARTPVRVIRGFKIFKSADSVGVTGRKISRFMYVYDGLYFVDDCWQERGPYGKLVFKFLLRRKLGQSKCNWDGIIGSKLLKFQKDDGEC